MLSNQGFPGRLLTKGKVGENSGSPDISNVPIKAAIALAYVSLSGQPDARIRNHCRKNGSTDSVHVSSVHRIYWAVDPKGMMSYGTEGENFRPSIRAWEPTSE